MWCLLGQTWPGLGPMVGLGAPQVCSRSYNRQGPAKGAPTQPVRIRKFHPENRGQDHTRGGRPAHQAGTWRASARWLCVTVGPHPHCPPRKQATCRSQDLQGPACRGGQENPPCLQPGVTRQARAAPKISVRTSDKNQLGQSRQDGAPGTETEGPEVGLGAALSSKGSERQLPRQG